MIIVVIIIIIMRIIIVMIVTITIIKHRAAQRANVPGSIARAVSRRRQQSPSEA